MDYQLANFIVNMLVAIGTVGSVAFSLWFAVLSRREKAKVNISAAIAAGTREEYVNIIIVNKGSLDYRLSHMYFHLNDITIMPLPLQFYVPLPDDKTPNPPGYRVSCYLHMEAFDAFVNNKQPVTPEQTIQILKKGYVIIYTSRGTLFKVRFPKSFITNYHKYRLSKNESDRRGNA